MTEKYVLGQKVDLRILRETELGFTAMINEQDEGLLYHNEIFEVLSPGQKIPGFIKFIRPNGSIDLQLKAFGNLGAQELAEEILDHIKMNSGYMALNAKSPAEKVYDTFGVSKKNFKMALGALYKKRLVSFTEEGTKLVAAAD